MAERPVKKIIFFIPTLSGGGAERVASELLCNMPASVEGHLVLFENRIGYEYKGRPVSLDTGVSGSRSIFRKAINVFMRFVRFRKIVRDLQPDAVISFLQANSVNALVRTASFKIRYRAIVSERSVTSKNEFLSDRIYSFLSKAAIKFLYNRSDRVIAVSEEVKSDLVNNFDIKAEKIKVIYNPVDSNKLAILASEKAEHPWFSEKIPVLISVGRLSKEKNQKDLLFALADIRKDIPCRLMLVGEGNLKDDLRRLAGSLGMDKDVALMGFQSNPFKYVARSTVFILPSLFEGFPNALLEAMAVGCPVISSDCVAGPKEILGPEAKYGMLFKTGDVKSMVVCVRKLLSDGPLRLRYSKAGRERAEEFGVSRIVGEYLKVLTGTDD